jgi:carboxylesterase
MRPPERLAGGEPFFYRGNEIGCLCIHGFGASPDEVRWYGEYLAEQGYTVYGVRLPAHGTDYQDMSRAHWSDWYNAVFDAYLVLRAQCEKVVVCGLSMGGLLSLLLSAWGDVDGVIVMGAPIELENMDVLSKAWLIKYPRPYIEAGDTSELPHIINEERARRGEPLRGRVRYDRWATNGVQQLHDLIVQTREVLTAVHAPVLVMYSVNDQTVPISNQQMLIDGLLNASITSHTYQVSGHILTQDVERQDVMSRSADWIADLFAS